MEKSIGFLGTMKKSFEFTVVLDEFEITTQMADNLYCAGCDDALLSQSNEIVSLDFYRDAESLDEAIDSAREDIFAAGYKIKEIQIEPFPGRPLIYKNNYISDEEIESIEHISKDRLSKIR